MRSGRSFGVAVVVFFEDTVGVIAVAVLAVVVVLGAVAAAAILVDATICFVCFSETADAATADTDDTAAVVATATSVAASAADANPDAADDCVCGKFARVISDKDVPDTKDTLSVSNCGIVEVVGFVFSFCVTETAVSRGHGRANAGCAGRNKEDCCTRDRCGNGSVVSAGKKCNEEDDNPDDDDDVANECRCVKEAGI